MNALLNRAGRARHPGVAAMCDSYAQLAGRVDRTSPGSAKRPPAAVRYEFANVDARMALVLRDMRAGRSGELGVVKRTTTECLQ
ncbi:MAG: hypothetical protein U1E17_09495 [Geminicoccaceae bacterium]